MKHTQPVQTCGGLIELDRRDAALLPSYLRTAQSIGRCSAPCPAASVRNVPGSKCQLCDRVGPTPWPPPPILCKEVFSFIRLRRGRSAKVVSALDLTFWLKAEGRWPSAITHRPSGRHGIYLQQHICRYSPAIARHRSSVRLSQGYGFRGNDLQRAPSDPDPASGVANGGTANYLLQRIGSRERLIT